MGQGEHTFEELDEMSFVDKIKELAGGSWLSASLDPTRPYDGQPHTDAGERGKTLVEGLTMRDIVDCYIVGAFYASGLPTSEYPETIYGLPWDEIDPMAVSQNMTCEIERRMGIYPNVPDLEIER